MLCLFLAAIWCGLAALVHQACSRERGTVDSFVLGVNQKLIMLHKYACAMHSITALKPAPICLLLNLCLDKWYILKLMA